MALLMCDVDMAEQAELRQLENGSPHSPGAFGPEWGAAPTNASVLVPSPETVMASSEMPLAMAVLAEAREAATVGRPALVSLVGPSVPTAAAPSPRPLCNSTVEAARRRARGPSVSERRATEQRLEAEATAAHGRKRQRAAAKPAAASQIRQRAATELAAASQRMGAMAVELAWPMEAGCEEVPRAEAVPMELATPQRRGRVRANGRLAAAEGEGVSEFATQRRTLMEKGEYRRSRAVHAVAPAGTRDLNEAPDFVRDFGGASDAADAFEEAMLTWADDNLNEGGAEERTLDQKDRNVGKVNRSILYT